MKTSKELLAEELSALYPDVTDNELEIMVDKLIDFFLLSGQAVYQYKKQQKTPD